MDVSRVQNATYWCEFEPRAFPESPLGELLESLFPTDRPGLKALMRDARRGAFDVVLVWRFDRFARSIEQLVLALAEFRTHGCCTAVSGPKPGFRFDKASPNVTRKTLIDVR